MSLTIISYSRRHRNCGFFFLANRPALNLLFEATAQPILEWSRQQGFIPGIVAVLHTFGGDLRFHPHIHILLTEGGITDANTWQQCHFFPEKVLKARFRPIKWRERVLNNFGYDPLLCPECGELMVLKQIVIPTKHGPPKVINIF